MKKDILVQTRFKTKAKCNQLIKQLNALDEAVVTSTYEDILAGRVGKQTLRPIIDMVSCKMRQHPDFQSVEAKYISTALYDIGNKIDADVAFKLSISPENTDTPPLITTKNITAGLVGKNHLLKIIEEIGRKIQKHPDFISTPCKYISNALIEIGSGKNPDTVLKIKKGSRFKNSMIDEQRIAYAAWYKIKIKGEKTIAVFSELATDGKSSAVIKKYYERYHNKITEMFMSIRSKLPSD